MRSEDEIKELRKDCNHCKFHDYKQALEQIREINKEFFDMNYGFDEQGISEDVKEVAREIQDKINDLLGE